MAVFKCKMCGASLDIVEGATVCECEYCETKQTVPKAMDDNLQNLCNRANTLRIKGEFDKSAQIYEKIVQLDSTQSEAYWGLILCKYGIEYVDDPKTFKKIPTCHRASYESIIADEDYKSALANADIMQRSVYEEQAKEIDRIQKEILALAQKEETYDVFICYKETDANGQRTQDSVIANDIYYQLKDAGYKVFYAAITLEGKLGSAYEPIIFAALNSAKVMLVIGTNPDYFNAVWVKNEWSRFLKIIQKDRSKLLIPCYRDMDAYELPEEFAHLQAQDMSKIGFINDIVRGIKKVVVKNEPVKDVEAPKAQNNAFDALIKRIYLLLEDGDFDKADELCEQVLNGDPENAEAYICELLIEFKCHTKDELSSAKQSITNSKNYSKVIRFGNNEQIAYVKGVEGSVQAYFKKLREEEERKKEEERQRAEELKRKQEEEAKRESSVGLEFQLNEDGKGYTLTKVGSCKDKNIVIDMHKGLPVTSIGDTAFSWCSNLTTITLSNSVTSIGVWAFEMCSNLTSITIPNSVTSIGGYAFKDCSNLTSITIPNSVTSIGKSAFSYCSNLTSITIPNSVTSIGEDVFSCCKKLTNISVDKNNTKYKSINGNVYTKDEKTLVCYAVGKTDKSFTIPNSVTSIGNCAFYLCKNLTSIAIPNSVTSIGNSAFWGCTNLTSIYCFDNWDNIVGIKYAGIPKETKIFHYSEKKPSLKLFKRYWHYVNGVPTKW